MEKAIRPKNAKPLFDFKLKNILTSELEDWPDAGITKGQSWVTAVSEFKKHYRYVFEITFGSPYPISSYAIGAAEMNDNHVHIRLFLFPMEHPKYQRESIGQIVCEFECDSNVFDINVWQDFLDPKDIDNALGKIIFIQWTLRLIGKLKMENPESIHLLKNQDEVEKLNLLDDSVNKSEIYPLDDIESIMDFINGRISCGEEVAIYFPSKDMGVFTSAKNLISNK